MWFSKIGIAHKYIRWGSMAPLRQFKGVPTEVIRKAEGKQFVSDICLPTVLLLKMPIFHSVGSVAQSSLDPS